MTQTTIHIMGEGTMKATGNRFFLVTSSQYATTNRVYIVEQHPGHLTCNCPARKPCKHIKLVAEHINAERKEASHVAGDAAKWALIEQVMPDRAAEMHQAAHEATTMLAQMVAKMDAIQIDENLWGDTHNKATAPLADTSYAGSIFKPEGARARVIEEW